MYTPYKQAILIAIIQPPVTAITKPVYRRERERRTGPQLAYAIL